MHHLILASESPRRKEILQNAGFRFQVAPVKVSELPDKTLNVREQILQIAGRKARAAVESLQKQFSSPFVVLAADTEVIWEDATLGKPSSPEHAAQTLRRLSGSVHDVVTAVWMIDNPEGNAFSHLETTKVYFRDLTEQEILDYVATGEPMDKAGSYGIQGLGGKLVRRIDGDFQNVVGLPMEAVKNLMAAGGWKWTR